MVHGIALVGPYSVNDGAEIDSRAHADLARLINAAPDPITVQYYHFDATTFAANGGIVNAYQDGDTLRGTHMLNAAKDTTGEILENAEKFRANLCYSFEARNNDLVYEGPRGKRRIVGAKSLKWFALGRECGTTRGMNSKVRRETKIRRSRPMAKATVKQPTLAQLKSRYPETLGAFADAIRAETSATAENDQRVADLTAENEELTADRDAARSEADELKAEKAKADRIDAIQSQWAELIKEVDVTKLPDTDAGKRIAALEELDDAFLDSISGMEEADATSQLQTRIDTIENNLVVAETLSPTSPTNVPAGGVRAEGKVKTTNSAVADHLPADEF